MAAAAFDVLRYTDATFDEQLGNPHVEPDRIGAKLQVEFLKGYLREIGAETIVVEHDYVDRDYLEDFSAYYVRCFLGYERHCKRLHFFSSKFSKTFFTEAISAGAERPKGKRLAKNYLGFIVVKPLPDTVIGRSCLVTYPKDGARNYQVVRDYAVNLFGMPLVVTKTLAFQEQDRVVAACASSALWSAFHGTCNEFGHALLSPAEITKAAGAKASDVDRNLPNKGLTWRMMADAIRHVGLEPLYSQAADENDLKGMIYAYVRGRIPAILGFNRHDPSEDPEAWKKQAHAVTVAGVRLDAKGTKPKADKDGLRVYAYRIDRLYVHDDQIGPFARMFLDGKTCKVYDNGVNYDCFSLRTLYPDKNGNEGNVRAIDPIVLLPLYHKIRIPYSAIRETVYHLNVGLDLILSNVKMKRELEWDIYLTTNNDFKKELSENLTLDPVRKLRYLTTSLPRFLWRARALEDDAHVLDLLFDATGIEQGSLFSLVIEYDRDMADWMPKVFGQENNKALFAEASARKIVDWYIAWQSNRQRTGQ